MRTALDQEINILLIRSTIHDSHVLINVYLGKHTETNGIFIFLLIQLRA